MDSNVPLLSICKKVLSGVKLEKDHRVRFLHRFIGYKRRSARNLLKVKVAKEEEEDVAEEEMSLDKSFLKQKIIF